MVIYNAFMIFSLVLNIFFCWPRKVSNNRYPIQYTVFAMWVFCFARKLVNNNYRNKFALHRLHVSPFSSFANLHVRVWPLAIHWQFKSHWKYCIYAWHEYAYEKKIKSSGKIVENVATTILNSLRYNDLKYFCFNFCMCCYGYLHSKWYTCTLKRPV